jgi:hypothetical protein
MIFRRVVFPARRSAEQADALAPVDLKADSVQDDAVLLERFFHGYDVDVSHIAHPIDRMFLLWNTTPAASTECGHLPA